MTYEHLKPQKPSQRYIPRVFGFKLHKPWNLMYEAIKLDKDAAWHCGETGVSQGLETLEDIYKSTIGKIIRSVKFYHAASLVYLGWAHLSNIWM